MEYGRDPPLLPYPATAACCQPEDSTVEAYYRAADYLEMSCIMEACIGYVTACLPSPPLEVRQFGHDMPGTPLHAAAEEFIINTFHWSETGRWLVDICKDSSDEHVTDLLLRYRKVAISELQVVQFLIEDGDLVVSKRYLGCLLSTT
ncbi:hypothetical protein WJX72_002857 [[Myrmecia] bisecta]|uniref:Uncharacterized protein n=1 Tax=[Myrmecia] bisecta TaxID=41462 RepID=A0AAW1P9J5_9CHLO